MATKKKVVKKSRVSPALPAQDRRFVKYEDLKDGEAFLLDGKLWIKFDVGDQEGFELNNSGNWDVLLCDKVVEPVDITINWKRK